MGGMLSALMMAAMLIMTPILQHATPADALDPEAFEVQSEAIDDNAGQIIAKGSHALFQAHAKFDSWSFTDVNIDSEDFAKSRVVIEIDLSSLRSPLFWIVPLIKSQGFLEVEEYPVSRVEISGIEPQRVNVYGVGTYKGAVELEIRDVSRTYEIEFRITEPAPVRASGTFKINRSDYGIGDPLHPLNIFGMRDEVEIEFDLEIPAEIEPVGFFIFGYPDSGGQ